MRMTSTGSPQVLRPLTLFLALVLSAALFVSCAADDGEGSGSEGGDADVEASDSGGTADSAGDSAGDSVPDETVAEIIEAPGLVRFVHVSDIHYHGSPEDPRYEWLQSRVDRINGIDFEPDYIVITGDNIDYVPVELENDPTKPSSLSLLVEAFDEGLETPYLITIGNHEYYDSEEPLIITEDPAARRDWFEAVTGQAVDQAVVVNGVRFITLNSMAGDAWNENGALLGSFTVEQLLWLGALLDDGVPSFLFFHHPPQTLANAPAEESICAVMAEHSGVVKAVFGGHLHTFWKGIDCDAPYYTVGNLRDDDDSVFLVLYDGETDSLNIMNEDTVPFPTVPAYECEEGQDAIADFSAAVGSTHLLVVENTSTDAVGLGQYVGDALQALPLMLQIDAWDPDTETLTARFSLGNRWSEDGFYDVLTGAACEAFDLRVTDPCAIAGPIRFAIDAAPFLSEFTEEPVDPSWKIRLLVDELRIEARFGFTEASPDVPVLEAGIVYARIEGGMTAEDLKSIVLEEYCAGEIVDCVPESSDEFPVCPADYELAFFDELPKVCDIEIEGFTARSILQIVGSLPESVSAIGDLHSAILPVSDEPVQGHASSGIFSTEPGANCAE